MTTDLVVEGARAHRSTHPHRRVIRSCVFPSSGSLSLLQQACQPFESLFRRIYLFVFHLPFFFFASHFTHSNLHNIIEPGALHYNISPV